MNSAVKLRDVSKTTAMALKQAVIEAEEPFNNEEVDEFVDKLDDVLEEAVYLDTDYSIFTKNRDLENLRWSDDFTTDAIDLCNKALRIFNNL